MGVEDLPKACVILGAGASYDVHSDYSSLVRSPEFRPPLAQGLFDILNNPEYASQIMSYYPDAYTLTQDIAPRIASKNVDLETALREYVEHRDPRVRQMFKQVPAYLRDLLHRCSTGYTDVPSCYVQLALRLLSHSPHEVLFIVLNYDTLLETASSRVDSNLRYARPARGLGRTAEAAGVAGARLRASGHGAELRRPGGLQPQAARLIKSAGSPEHSGDSPGLSADRCRRR